MQFTCDICGAQQSTLESHLAHLNRHTTDVLPCWVCGKKYARSEDLSHHYLSHDILRLTIDPLLSAHRRTASHLLVESGQQVLLFENNRLAVRKELMARTLDNFMRSKVIESINAAQPEEALSATSLRARAMRSIIVPPPKKTLKKRKSSTKPWEPQPSTSRQSDTSVAPDPTKRVKTEPIRPGIVPQNILSGTCKKGHKTKNSKKSSQTVVKVEDQNEVEPSTGTIGDTPMIIVTLDQVLCSICHLTRSNGCRHLNSEEIADLGEELRAYGLIQDAENLLDSTIGAVDPPESYTTAEGGDTPSDPTPEEDRWSIDSVAIEDLFGSVSSSSDSDCEPDNGPKNF